MSSFFTYDSYRAFLGRIVRIGDVGGTAHRKAAGGPGILLRHDVDFSISAARELAEIEKEMGVGSVYYVLTTSPFYNPCSAANREMLAGMHDDGFEIGLHFDPTVYGDLTAGELEEAAAAETRVLERITGSGIRSISLHNPSVHGRYPLFDGFENAYDPAVFSDATYLSDSSMDFRGKDPHEFVAKARDAAIQILLHPVHFSPDGAGYVEIFRRRVVSFVEEIDAYFQVNKTYVSCRGNIPLTDHVWRRQE